MNEAGPVSEIGSITTSVAVIIVPTVNLILTWIATRKVDRNTALTERIAEIASLHRQVDDLKERQSHLVEGGTR